MIPLMHKQTGERERGELSSVGDIPLLHRKARTHTTHDGDVINRPRQGLVRLCEIAEK